MHANSFNGVQFRAIQEHLEAIQEAFEKIADNNYDDGQEIYYILYNYIKPALCDVEPIAYKQKFPSWLVDWFAAHGWTLELEYDINTTFNRYQFHLYPKGCPECQLVGACNGLATLSGLYKEVQNALNLTPKDIAINWLEDIETPIGVDDLEEETAKAAEKLYAELPALLEELEQEVI